MWLRFQKRKQNDEKNFPPPFPGFFFGFAGREVFNPLAEEAQKLHEEFLRLQQKGMQLTSGQVMMEVGNGSGWFWEWLGVLLVWFGCFVFSSCLEGPVFSFYFGFLDGKSLGEWKIPFVMRLLKKKTSYIPCFNLQPTTCLGFLLVGRRSFPAESKAHVDYTKRTKNFQGEGTATVFQPGRCGTLRRWAGIIRVKVRVVAMSLKLNPKP